jgi:ribosomal protein S18 acetylase RimI-like enzyme
MNFAIEQLQLDELRNFLREQADDAFPDLKDEQHLNTLAEKWSKNAEFCACRNAEGGLVGMIAFYANGEGADFAYIPHVYVSPDFQGKGVFKQMLQLVENKVRAKGFEEIRLEVHNDNHAALECYKRTGFVWFDAASSDSVFLKKTI